SLRSPTYPERSSPTLLRTRGFLDGLDDARVASAAAQVIVHVPYDFRSCWPRRFLEQHIRAQDHARCAVTALKGVMPQKCLLDGVQLSFVFQPLDRQHGFSCHLADRRRAGPDRLVVHHNCAGATKALATAILGSGQAEVVAQNPQQHTFVIDSQASRLAVQSERNRSSHIVANTLMPGICYDMRRTISFTL